jgi:hypothetical protein
MRVRAGSAWKRTSYYCSYCSLLSSHSEPVKPVEPVTQRVSIDYMHDIIPLDDGLRMSTPESMIKAAKILMADSDPFNPLFAAEDALLTQQVDDEVYITVYWIDTRDEYSIAGWPVPMWLLDCIEPNDINLTGSESLRMWL